MKILDYVKNEKVLCFVGGKVQVESEKGKGRKFTFKMPIADR